MKSPMFISKYETQIYAIFRILIGILFLLHGSQKLFSIPPEAHEVPGYIMFIGAPIEFLGGLLIVIGLWTPWVAFVCCGEMAFAYWSSHGTHAFLPIMNGGELAFIYCILFFTMFSKGSGPFSLDHLLSKRKSSRLNAFADEFSEV